MYNFFESVIKFRKVYDCLILDIHFIDKFIYNLYLKTVLDSRPLADSITITTLHNQETVTMADQKPDNDVQGKYNIMKIISSTRDHNMSPFFILVMCTPYNTCEQTVFSTGIL